MKWIITSHKLIKSNDIMFVRKKFLLFWNGKIKKVDNAKDKRVYLL